MPTVTEIDTIGFVAQYLASNDVSNGALFGAIPNPNIAEQIYLIRKPVHTRYVQEDIAGGSTPSASLMQASNYAYSWYGNYGLYALALINQGGVIPTPGGTTIYGYPISGSYVAVADGETVIDLSLPTGAIVIQVTKSILQLTTSQYSYASPNLTLLGGISLSAGEQLFYLYVVPIT
jgi:hypothetical protein